MPVDGALCDEGGSFRDPVLEIALLDRLEALKEKSTEPVFAELGEEGLKSVFNEVG